MQYEFYSFANQYTPTMPPLNTAPYIAGSGDISTSGNGSSNKKGATSGGFNRDMAEKWLGEKGLTGEVIALLDQFGTAIDNAFDPITGKATPAMYKILLPKLNELRRNEQMFEEATKEMRANGALDEIAINTRGEAYVMDPEKGLVTIKVDNLQQGQRYLTNGELANFRANDPRAAFNNDMINTISRGVGMEKIMEYINKSISGLGQTTQENAGFVSNSQNIEGGQALRELIKNGGLVKQEVKQTSQYDQAMAALSTLLATLPENMKNVLKVKAINSNSTVEDLVTNLVMSKTSSVEKVDIQATGGSSKGSAEEALEKLNQDPVTMFALGKTPQFGFKMDLGGKYAYVGMARLGHLLDGTGKPMSPYDTLQDVFAGKFSGILDQNNVTMGSMKIRSFDEVRIANNQISSIELPVDFSSDVIRPDITKLKTIQEVEQKIADEGIAENDYQAINEQYIAAGLQPKYSNDGRLTETYARFAVVSAYANEEALEANSDVDEGFDETISHVPEGALSEALQRHFEIRKGSNKVYSIDEDNIIQGNVFIPIISPQNGYAEAILAAYQTNGIDMSTVQANKLQEKAGQDQAKNQYGFVSGGSFVE